MGTTQYFIDKRQMAKFIHRNNRKCKPFCPMLLKTYIQRRQEKQTLFYLYLSSKMHHELFPFI